MWQREHHIETSASPEAIWAIFKDVPGWKAWNAGIEQISIDGPFAEGTPFTMQPPGQPAFTSRLVRVLDNKLFEDETIVDDVCVRVAHRIDRVGPRRTRVTYAISVTGPGADDIGAAVSADFPDVLKALAALAER